ncbi:MAG: hypothetical protein M1418_06240 [Deltaproteobacteria bacterium]|nr:hypothetical protein [Deltaproteobacteria bacterium]
MHDDLFEGSRRKRPTDHCGHDRHHAGYGGEKHGYYNPLLNLAQKVLRNKALLAGIVLTLLVIGALGIWLLVTLLLYFVPALSTVGTVLEQKGIKGILETLTPLLQKIWEGAGK